MSVEHDLFEILGSLPNPEQTAYTFKHAMQWQLLQYGRAYAEVVRQDGRIVALWPLQSESMRVDRDEQRRKRWISTARAAVACSGRSTPHSRPSWSWYTKRRCAGAGS